MRTTPKPEKPTAAIPHPAPRWAPSPAPVGAGADGPALVRAGHCPAPSGAAPEVLLLAQPAGFLAPVRPAAFRATLRLRGSPGAVPGRHRPPTLAAATRAAAGCSPATERPPVPGRSA